MRCQKSQMFTRQANLHLSQDKDTTNQIEFSQYHRQFAEGYLLHLIDDARERMCMLYGSADYTRDRACLSRRLKNEGFSFVAHALPNLMSGFLGYLETGTASYPGFKLQAKTNNPRFLRRLFDIATNKNHCTEIQAIALETIYNISTCFKKLRGSPDMDRHQQQFDAFVATDKAIGTVDEEFLSSPDIEPIMASVSTQWMSFASDINIDDRDCIPRPGPGATVDSVAKHLRYAPQVLYKTLDKEFPYSEWFYSHPWDLVEESRNYKQLLKSAVQTPHSEYLLVPKTFLKWRGICKEANEVQCIQQALRRTLYAHIERKLGSQIPIRDQKVHQVLALKASIDRENATIDESEASDRIPRTVVHRMMEYTPELRDQIFAASTEYVKPPKWARQKGYIKTNKFAPMGSAICFPIMSIVHLFLVKAIILTKALDIEYAERTRLCKAVSVYGDDIVLPSRIVPLVYEWLPRFGMKINTEKSFVHSHFRESCGCHAYKGCDITPVYIKYTNFSSKEASDVKRLMSLFAAEELLVQKQFHRTAEFLRKYIQAKWGKFPYVSNVTSLVGFRRPPSSLVLTDFSLLNKKSVSRRWDRHLQSNKFRLKVWKVVTEKGVIPSVQQEYLRSMWVRPQRNVSYVWSERGLNTPFRMDEWVSRLDDETLAIKTTYATFYPSMLRGHNLKGLDLSN